MQEPPRASSDPVHCKVVMVDGSNTGIPYRQMKYFFWDETWSYEHGPYDTEIEARQELTNYIKHLDGVPSQ